MQKQAREETTFVRFGGSQSTVHRIGLKVGAVGTHVREFLHSGPMRLAFRCFNTGVRVFIPWLTRGDKDRFIICII